MKEEYKKIILMYSHKGIDIKEFEADFKRSFDVKEFKVTTQKNEDYVINIMYKNKEKKSNAGRKKKVADKNMETIIKLHDDGWSYDKIAKFYGITRNTLYNNLKKYKALKDTEIKKDEKPSNNLPS